MKRLVGCVVAVMVVIGACPVAAQEDGTRPVITAANVDGLRPVYVFSGESYHDLAWSPDGSQLALGAYDGVWLVDMTADDPEPVRLPGTEEYIYSLAYHPEKSLLAVGYDFNRVELFDTITGELIAELPEHVWTVLDVAFSPDGNLLVTSGMGGVIRLMDVESGAIVHELTSMTEANRAWVSVIFHPTENTIIGGGDWMQYWDVTSGEPLGWYLEPHPHLGTYIVVGVNCFDFNGENTLLATGGFGYFTLWNLKTETQLASLGNYPAIMVEVVSFSADGRLLVVAGMSGVLEVWNIANLTSVWQGPPSDEIVYGAAFSPDQTLLAYATTGGDVVIMGVIED